MARVGVLLRRWYNYSPALFYAVKSALFKNKDKVITRDSVPPAINAKSKSALPIKPAPPAPRNCSTGDINQYNQRQSHRIKKFR